MESGGGDHAGLSRPPPPVLLIDGHEFENEQQGLIDLTGRFDELVTSEEMFGERESYSPTDEKFEKIIGAIEEIVIGEEFQALQNFFLSNYWTKFSEENSTEAGLLSEATNESSNDSKSEERHEHFKIFKTYSQEMAQLLESQLKKAFRDEHFDFNKFVEDFGRRVESSGDSCNNSMVESEIFEMLYTLIDFLKFKELFTDYKEMMEGKTPNLATGITLKPCPQTPRNRSAETTLE